MTKDTGEPAAPRRLILCPNHLPERLIFACKCNTMSKFHVHLSLWWIWTKELDKVDLGESRERVVTKDITD